MKEKENILMDDSQTTKTYLRCGQQTKYTNVNGDRGKRAVGPDLTTFEISCLQILLHKNSSSVLATFWAIFKLLLLSKNFCCYFCANFMAKLDYFLLQRLVTLLVIYNSVCEREKEGDSHRRLD